VSGLLAKSNNREIYEFGGKAYVARMLSGVPVKMIYHAQEMNQSDSPLLS
jgi:hypothetical protein